MQSTTETPAAVDAVRWIEMEGERSITTFGSITLAVHRIPGLEGWYTSADPDIFRSQKIGPMPIEEARLQAVEMLRTALEATLAKVPGGHAPADLWALAKSAERRRIRQELTSWLVGDGDPRDAGLVGGRRIVDEIDRICPASTPHPHAYSDAIRMKSIRERRDE
jgi:hypothetical protein